MTFNIYNFYRLTYPPYGYTREEYTNVLAGRLNDLFNDYLNIVSQRDGITKDEAFRRFNTVLASDGVIRASSRLSLNTGEQGTIPKSATLSSIPDSSVLESLLGSNGTSEEISLETMCNVLKNPKKNSEQIKRIVEYFRCNPKEFGAFLAVTNDSHQKFDTFISAIDDLDLDLSKKEYIPLCNEILHFAFTPERFEAIQLQDSDIGPEMMKRFIQLEQSLKIGSLHERINLWSEHCPGKYSDWINQRTSGSDSLKDNPEKLQRWLNANSTKSRLLKKGDFRSEYIKHIHRLLAKVEVDGPGKYRTHHSKPFGQGLLGVFVHYNSIEGLMFQYTGWLKQEMEKCRVGKKSAIILAAQAYQRLVSIHPFRDGNGRVSRLMMDYVLESFNLPPAALGCSVLDGLFCARPRSKKRIDIIFKVYVFFLFCHDMFLNVKGKKKLKSECKK